MNANYFRMAVDEASDHIIITDTKGIITYANKAVARVTGYSPTEVLGKRPGEVWGGHMPKAFYVKMWRRIHDRRRVFVGEIHNRRKNGEDYTAEVRIAPVLDARGRIRSYIGIERDVTREREIDRAKTEFIALASHQLRTPLTGIKWFAELAAKESVGTHTAAQRQCLRRIREGTARMARLIDDLLNVSRIEAGRKFGILPQPTDVAAIVRGVAAEQQPLARKRRIAIRIGARFAKPLVLAVDGEKIRQVFLNLIGNAVKYSRDRGVIRVRYARRPTAHVFSVEDRGIGIPAADQRRIFEKFFRAENARVAHADGTGLGLFIVKAIVEGHGGRVWFTSTENIGTTFSCSLPLHARIRSGRTTR